MGYDTAVAVTRPAFAVAHVERILSTTLARCRCRRLWAPAGWCVGISEGHQAAICRGCCIDDDVLLSVVAGLFRRLLGTISECGGATYVRPQRSC